MARILTYGCLRTAVGVLALGWSTVAAQYPAAGSRQNEPSATLLMRLPAPSPPQPALPGSQVRFVQPAAGPQQQPPATPAELLPRQDAGHEQPAPASNCYPIDLPTALQLADASNLQVRLAREQVLAAYALLGQADALWLPSLRAGVHWNKHEGTLQETNGNVLNVSRTSLYAGSGGQAVGAGSPMIPGLLANFHLADAIFLPLQAQQRIGARQRGAAAMRNDVMLQVALAYLELLRAAEDLAIARDVRDKTAELSHLTDDYARSGQGLLADADRLRVEVALRENDVRRGEESLAVASARLAQLLRLDPCVCLQPLEPVVVPLELISCELPCCELVAQGLSNRPELAQNRFLVGEAVERLRRERYAPLVPSLLLGASYGGYGGGMNDNIVNFDDRFDFDATAYWELRNLGRGEAAARNAAQSQLRQAQLQQMATLDLVAREVVEAHAQVAARRRQIDTARQAISAAVQSHHRNLTRIQQAQGLPIEALQSTQALLQARREYLRSVIDYNSAQFTMHRALGWPVGDLAAMAPPQGRPH
jgi:outer membrane protein TolC